MGKLTAEVQSLEQQIAAKYGTIRGWIALHPLSAALLALASGLVVGWVKGKFL